MFAEKLNVDNNSGKKSFTERKPEEIWYCKEYWCGDSRDGQYINGDGYHFFQMQGHGNVRKAFEFYETDDGDERVCEVPELNNINWYEYFGFEDDELLEQVAETDFLYVEGLIKKD